jgi:hypothetical protein
MLICMFDKLNYHVNVDSFFCGIGIINLVCSCSEKKVKVKEYFKRNLIVIISWNKQWGRSSLSLSLNLESCLGWQL